MRLGRLRRRYPVWFVACSMATCPVLIFLVGWMGGDLHHTFRAWLLGAGSDPGALAISDNVPGLIFAFLIFRLLLCPFLLTHGRVDRESLEIRTENPRRVTLLVGVMEGAFLCMLVGAPATHGLRFSPLTFGLEQRLVIFLWICHLLVCLSVVAMVEPIFKFATGLPEASDESTFVGRREQAREFPEYLAGEVITAPLLYVALTFLFVGNYRLLIILICLFLAKIISIFALEFLSWWFDMRNDEWIESLARTMVLKTDRKSRLEAASKLQDLGQWAEPVKPYLKKATHDSDARVREVASAALAEIDKATSPSP